MLVGGYYRQHSNFTFATAPKSGHFMPYDNYDVAKAFLDDFTQNNSLTCHNPEGCRVNVQMCSAMNNCSGHGSCMDNGMCMCEPTHKGADCSFEAHRMTNETEEFTISSVGDEWIYLTHEHPEGDLSDWTVTMTAKYGSKFSVYISKEFDESPNQFFYDIYVTEVKPGIPFTLSRDFVSRDNFTVALHIHGYN